MSSALTLIPTLFSCRACGHKWDGYDTGFSRGHTVLKRGDRIAFIIDDLLYCFPDAMKRAERAPSDQRLLDFGAPLRRLGWRDFFDGCPACGSHDCSCKRSTQRIEVSCTDFDEADFVMIDDRWELTTAGHMKERGD